MVDKWDPPWRFPPTREWRRNIFFNLQFLFHFMNFAILISLFFCHFLADYTPLLNSWMLQAKSIGKPLFPILAHASVHAILMSLCLWFFWINGVLIVQLFFVQLFTHFIIDLVKGRLQGTYPILNDSKGNPYWILMGVDQYLHTLVIIFMTSYVG